MGFCDLHKQECEHIVNIIEVKRGKITELNLCLDCLAELNVDISDIKINEIKYLMFKNECPKCGITEQELAGSKLLCTNCFKHFNVENKLSLLETKMNAAVQIEDYEAAFLLKKQIEEIKNS